MAGSMSATAGNDGAAGPVDAREMDAIVTSVRSLVEIMRAGGIAELDLTFADVSLHLRGGSTVAATVIAAAASQHIADQAEPIFSMPGPEQHITSPMVGTFYASPTPGAPAYVRVGDHVEVGQTVGIIEAMKIMNEITADRAGLVIAVLAENGQAVEYGSPIVRLDPTRGGTVTVVTNGS